MAVTPVRKTVGNGDVTIEYFVSGQVNEKASLVVSMGVCQSAVAAFPLITRLTDRHCIVLSYRGRGGSTTPPTGFDWPQCASDLAAVLKQEPVNRPVFLGFSKGVPYTLGFLAGNPKLAQGIILIDQPAVHIRPDSGYARFWQELIYNGVPVTNFVTPETLTGIERESTYREFYADLAGMDCPVWVFRGTDPVAATRSDMTDADIARYRVAVKRLEVVEFSLSGHMILDDELGKACHEVGRALATVDALACAGK